MNFEQEIATLTKQSQATIGLTENLERDIRRCCILHPDMPASYLLLGLGLRQSQRFEEAQKWLLRAAGLDPKNGEALSELGALFATAHEFSLVRQFYQASEAAKPTPLNRLRCAFLVPPVPSSRAEIEQIRARLMSVLQDPDISDLAITDPFRDIPRTSFYLAYHGLDDRPIQEALAQFYLKAFPALDWMADHCTNLNPPSDRRIRVGFVSQYFFSHTVFRYSEKLIASLDRDRFETFIFHYDSLDRDAVDHLKTVSDHVIAGPASVFELRRIIAEQKLDILVYPEIGMDQSIYLLSLARLAPVQVALGGHPVTSGVPTIDYYITGDGMEKPEAEDHYSEKLVRVPFIPVGYQRPPAAADKTREELGLPSDRTIYLCTQTLFKLHPEFDRLVAEILHKDPNGILVVFEPPATERGLAAEIVARMGKVWPELPKRLLVIPRRSLPDYLAVVANADVVLDGIHFCGGDSTLTALSVGAPVITMPTEFARGRQTLADYKLIGVEDCIAETPSEYVSKALAIAGNQEMRTDISRRILENVSRLYDNLDSVAEIEEFLTRAVTGR